MSHSKRNTSRAVFTSHERELAGKSWGSASARLTRESFLDFSACRLCLEIARDPVSCPHGDVFCRECALSNILAQKQEIKRLERTRENERREADEDRARREAEDHERAVREFEMTQHGLGSAATTARKSTTAKSSDREVWIDRSTGITTTDSIAVRDTGTNSDGGNRVAKRKFEMDDDEIARIAAEDRAKARKAIEDEKAARPTLPSFWTPSITPSSNTKDVLHDVVRKAKTVPVCPASAEEKPHMYSLHTLVTIRFTEEEDEKESQRSAKHHRAVRVCPSCKKVLSNASKAMLAKPCGHVICRSCVDKFMRPAKHLDPHAPAIGADDLRCYVCDTDLVDRDENDDDKNNHGEDEESNIIDTENGKKKKKGDKKKKNKKKDKIRPGLVELRSEGTGFSAGGANQVRKSGIAFQC
ncbi:hypothetical protein F4809DRAFT_640356 [Biscogniauxia mediterranea]|nr:hypothetical protein F4809DRAFT_640356 [Biscogniauxia mediterranea]